MLNILQLLVHAQQWGHTSETECEIWPWRLGQYINTHWGSDRSRSTFLQFIFPAFHHFPQLLCWLISDLACRSLEVTDKKLVLCQRAQRWGKTQVTQTHKNKYTHELRRGRRVHCCSRWGRNLPVACYTVLFSIKSVQVCQTFCTICSSTKWSNY